MYHRRLEFNVTAGNLGVFEEGQTAVGELRKKQKGFLGQSLLQSYGYPGKYTLTVRWESWDAADAFARSKAFRDMVQADPPAGRGVIQTRPRPTEAYESVLEVNADPVPPETQCEVLIDLVIDRGPAGVAAFESRFAELAELRKQTVQGFGSSRLRRSLGNPFTYLAIHIYKDLESASKAREQAKIRQFASDHPLSEVTSVRPVIDTYRVVQRMSP